MTREEALKLWLPVVVMSVSDGRMPELKEAVEMAVTALESKSESESRMSYVQEAVNAIMNTCNTDSITDKAMRNAAKFVQNAIDGSYPEFEKLDQEPCGDAISRQSVNELVDELARAISDERCCISRGRSTATIMRDICHLPSVTPQQKMGKWITLKDEYGDVTEAVCSCCDKNGNHKWAFCPYCGQPKMQEVEE